MNIKEWYNDDREWKQWRDARLGGTWEQYCDRVTPLFQKFQTLIKKAPQIKKIVEDAIKNNPKNNGLPF